jgi:hypothetical protein
MLQGEPVLYVFSTVVWKVSLGVFLTVNTIHQLTFYISTSTHILTLKICLRFDYSIKLKLEEPPTFDIAEHGHVHSIS